MAELNLDISKLLNITVRRGNTIDHTIPVKNVDGTDFDFTGYTATWNVYTSVSDPTPNLVLTVTLALGSIRIQATAEVMQNMRTQGYIHRLVMTNGTNVAQWLNGKFRVKEEPVDGSIVSTDSLVINPNGTPVTITLTVTGSGSDHFKGLFISLAALELAFPTGEDGDYATVDPGPGTDAVTYIWDEDEGWIAGGSALPTFPSEITVTLSGGKSFGKYTTGQTIPATGLTAGEVIVLATNEYIHPAFTSFVMSGQGATVEVGTTLSGNKTFTWGISLGSGTVPTISIHDATANVDLLVGTPNDGSQVVDIGSHQLNANAAAYSWNGRLLDTAPTPDEEINSALFTVTARYLRFYGPVASVPINSAQVRAMASNAFHSGATVFTLFTGTVFNNFVVALPPGVTIASVIDLDALNADITSSYVLTGTVNVLDAGGTNRAYNVYAMTAGVPYATSHRHQITTVN